MDSIFDRLGDIVNSLIGGLGDPFSQKSKREGFGDPYMSEAWDELNDYLNDKEPAGSEQGRHSRADTGQRDFSENRDESLAQAYANLEVPYGTPFSEVKKAYKKMLRAYHPDRFAQDPEKLKIATEITKKMNAAFTRIKSTQA